MSKAIRWLLRTALLAAVGAAIMVALGQAYALTQATCSTICNPRVAGPLGAVAGILVSLMLPSVRWKPLDDDPGAR